MTLEEAKLTLLGAGYSVIQTSDKPNHLQVFKTGGHQPLAEILTDGVDVDEKAVLDFLKIG